MREAADRIAEICNQERLPLHRSVIEEMVKVSKGDMRKCINFLQNVYLFANWNMRGPDEKGLSAGNKRGLSEERPLDVDDFYRIIGSISPKEVELIFQILLKESYSSGRESEFKRGKDNTGGA